MMNKLKDDLTHWFRRCHGADELGMAILIAGVALVILGRILHFFPLTLASAALYIWAIYRMLSHNAASRCEENRKFKQMIARIRNIRTYKYYRCPHCKALLRMPRGIGEKTVTCSKCGHSFRQKA